jgi:hypothetical protein
MRRTLSLLNKYRKERLKQHKAAPKRLAEVDEFYRHFDMLLSGVTLNEVGGFDGPESALGEVMTTADFTNAMGDFVQRQMWPAYTQKRFEFEQFVKPDTTPNYQNVTRKQNRAGVDDLEWVGDKATARPGSVDDSVNRQYKVEVWQKQFDFSMRTLVNDDLGYLQDQATDMGRAARRTLEKFVSRFLWNATIIARLAALGALYTINGRLTSARVSTARMAFNQRLDARNEPINATLRYIVHHSGLVDTVRVIRASQLVPELATNAANVVAGDFVPVEDPYCAGTAPNLPWFAMTDWRADGIIPFVLARRQGVPAPMILRKKSDIESVTSLMGGGGQVAPIWGDFATGDVVIKVYDEFGTYIDGTDANMYDHRGCFYSPGTAP